MNGVSRHPRQMRTIMTCFHKASEAGKVAIAVGSVAPYVSLTRILTNQDAVDMLLARPIPHPNTTGADSIYTNLIITNPCPL